GDQLAAEEQRQGEERGAHLVHRHLEVEAQPEGEQVGGRGDGEVPHDGDGGAVADEQRMQLGCSGWRRSHAMALRAVAASAITSPSAPQTVSICRSVIAPKNGSARQRCPISSLTGKSPGLKPNRSR